MILIALLILILAVLAVRFRIRVTRDTGRWRLEIHYGRFTVLDTNTFRKGEKKKKRMRAVRPAKRKRPVPVGSIVRTAPELLAACIRTLEFVLCRIRLERCAVFGTIAGSDPAWTAETYGAICGLKAALAPRLSRVEIDLSPEFLDGETAISLDTAVSIRAMSLAALPFVLFFYLPKRALLRLVLDYRRR